VDRVPVVGGAPGDGRPAAMSRGVPSGKLAAESGVIASPPAARKLSRNLAAESGVIASRPAARNLDRISLGTGGSP